VTRSTKTCFFKIFFYNFKKTKNKRKTSGYSSVVERHLAKVHVARSNRVTRWSRSKGIALSRPRTAVYFYPFGSDKAGRLFPAKQVRRRKGDPAGLLRRTCEPVSSFSRRFIGIGRLGSGKENDDGLSVFLSGRGHSTWDRPPGTKICST
jgi:hypothetical protein